MNESYRWMEGMVTDPHDMRRARPTPARPDPDASRPRIEKAGNVWTIRSYRLAEQVLRARHQTTQAGFTSEAIPQGVFSHHPILISDGPTHDEQRRKVGRFFAPKFVEARYTELMHATAARLISQARMRGRVTVDELALHYSVEVTRGVVGLEHSSVRGMSKRLVRFFRQPPFDMSRKDLGRTRRQWAQAAWNGLLPVAHFWLADVRPSIRALRKRRGENVISHLIDEGYSNTEILIECVTYGTAGMVTTREFIGMALWHLLADERLRETYLAADQPSRLAQLEEILRLEPVVGHLYRRVQEPITVREHDEAWTLEPGDLVDIAVRSTNTDTEVFGEDASAVCPMRARQQGVDPAGLSFSAGSHKCPGKFLAVGETEVLVTALLRESPTLLTEPSVSWDHLIAGYQLRGMSIELTHQGTSTGPER